MKSRRSSRSRPTRADSSRAARTVFLDGAQNPRADPQRQRDVVEAFLVAAKSGDFPRLLSLLSPDAELAADAAAISIGAPGIRVGADEVASVFAGGARAARTVFLDGAAGLVWAQGGQARVASDFTVVDGKVNRIEMSGDGDVLDEIQIDYFRGAKGP